jgi:VWFA-related protein
MPLLVLALALAFQSAPGPEPPARQVTITVTDEKGGPVEGLGLQDVAVLEDGVARPVTEFEADSRPLTLAVLVDSSAPMSSFYRLNLVEPVERFLAALPEGSRFAVWTTGDRPQKVADYGQDAAQASRALRRVYPQGGNTLLDAIVEASRDLKDEEGRRAVVLIETGLGPGFTNHDRHRVVDEGMKSGATFLAVHFDEGRVTLDPRNRESGEVSAFEYEYVLEQLSERSGGQRQSLLSPMAIGTAVAQMAGAVRAQYRLRYEPLPAGGKDDRKLEVTVARPGARAQVGAVKP